MVRAAPRRRIELDDTGMVWRVEAGAASVMVEPAPEADLPRASATLRQAREGDCIFGFSSGVLSGRVRVFLESSPGTRLVPMMAEDFVRRCRDNPEEAAAMLSGAVRQVAAHVSPDIPPPSVAKILAPGGEFRLPSGARAAALSELWFRVEEGSAAYGGSEALGRLGRDGFHPLAGNLWVEMAGDGRLACVSTGDVIRDGTFLDAFSGFAAMAVAMTFERFSGMALAKLRHLVESSRHRGEAFSRALGRAAAVVDPAAGAGAGAPGAIEAVRLVAGRLGARVEAPPRLRPDLDGQVEDILSRNGFFSREVDLSGEWFADDSGPLLGFMASGRGREAVALLPGRKGYVLADPSGGRRKVTPELAAALEGRALQFYPPLPDGADSPLALARFACRGCGRELALVAAMGFFGGLAGFGLPLAMSATVDRVIANGEYGMLGQIVFGLLMLALGAGVFRMVKSAALLRGQTLAQVALQSAMFGRLLRLPMAFHRRFAAGDLSNRAMAVDDIRHSLSGTMLAGLLSSAFALTSLALLAVFSWKLSLVVLGIVAASLALTGLSLKRQARAQGRAQDAIGHLAGLELQLVTGVNKLRAAGAEAGAFARWMENFAELRRIAYAIGRGRNAVTVHATGLPLFCSIAVFGLFILSGLYRELSLGSFLCFNAALGQLTGAVASLAQAGTSLLFLQPLYRRAKPILEARPESHAALEDPGPLLGAVEAVGVDFAYPGAAGPTLRQVGFRAAPGEFVAIVGPSGSGKSTLLKLLLGFHQPSAGAVLYDGKPLRRLDPVKVRRQIGSVIQNGELIQGNIYFNIMGAARDADEEDAWEAARLAAVDDDIRAMPMGMHTFVPHGGSTFSGGQRQRIMLARALSRKPRVFLLDEATSSLDNASQATVMRNLRGLNATRIVVAHRLSTVRDADRIYVMDRGAVVESGTFGQLMERDGLFARLASRQMDGSGR
ncbi:NHLP bacteriocin export ABC transporter permease/ATPase subunit [Pseudodesulfovibrio sp.]|uniref:NHLP bacteriocin export ABC transporter permease/ATPase subunit n=1 Tax=Pseudodesulfovibrio sp. TaxID=2035812 RepID=UPI0026094B74|nr:NHLP bacteriocin export ABC transporter permease/ATPase subunit [Pseudodesulfovibrio sp.]MDD3311173.1 NHLP bacteriocin export ABC transporter permease/ATPase subunit [Pseudodesulfovibrio sp.]